MWAWTNPLDQGAQKSRDDHDFPPELKYYRVTALTGWNDAEYRTTPEATINELFMMDDIVRDADRRLLARAIANELALVLGPLLGGRIA